MAKDVVNYLKNNPLITVSLVAIVLAILGFSGVFEAVEGIAKILFIVAVLLLAFALYKKYGKNLPKLK